MEDKTVDFDNSKMAEEFIADVEKAFEKLSEMGFAEFTQISYPHTRKGMHCFLYQDERT